MSELNRRGRSGLASTHSPHSWRGTHELGVSTAIRLPLADDVAEIRREFEEIGEELIEGEERHGGAELGLERNGAFGVLKYASGGSLRIYF